MSEKKFITGIFIEGLILTVLGLCTLIIPKLTTLSYGVMLSIVFMAYGLYKILHSVFYKNYAPAFLYCLLLGSFVFVLGVLLLFVPDINLLWLIALTGVYFLLESISLKTFAAQIRNMYGFWIYVLLASCIIYLSGLIIILGIPVMSFWLVTVISGICFLVKGTAKLSVYFINRNNYV